MTGVTGGYDMELDVSGEEVRNAARAHGMVMRTPADAGPNPPERPCVRLRHVSPTVSAAAPDNAASTSLRSLTVRDVLFKYASPQTLARPVSTAF